MRFYFNGTQLILGICVIYFCIRLFFGVGSGRAESLASYCVYPFVKVHQWVTYPVQSLFEYCVTVETLHNQLSQIRSECDMLKSRLVCVYDHLDNSTITKIMNEHRLKYAYEDACRAQIMMKHCVHGSPHFIVVDRGSKHGIESDMVAVYKNCIVGRVAQVYPWYSKVIVVTDPSCKIPVHCVATGAQGVHEGLSSDENTVVNFVSHLDTVEDHDMIVSSGQGMIFPRGLLVAYITSSHVNGLHYDITARPAASIDEIQFCYLIHKSDIR